MSEEKRISNEEIPTPDTPGDDNNAPEEKKKLDPVKLWTGIVLALCILLFVWHLFGDKYTPYTSNSRIEAFVVPIAPEVSGILSQVNVSNNQVVSNDQELAVIDPAKYKLAVQRAEAEL